MNRVVVNPCAGRGRAGTLLAAIRRLATTTDTDVAVAASIHELRAYARRAVVEGTDRLIVVGGDGTVHHAIQELAGTSCALGIVPVGRGNDFAREFDVVRRVEAAFESALDGPLRAVDLGRLGGRAFATVAGIGIDADVLRYAEGRVRAIPPPLTYPAAFALAVRDFRARRLRIEHDAGSFEGRVTLIAVANTSRFGGGMRIAPAALPDDGLLDLVIVGEVSRSELLLFFPLVYRGAHLRHRAVTVVRTRTVSVSGDAPIDLQADGEIVLAGASAPILIEAWPRALSLSGFAVIGPTATTIPSVSVSG